MFLIVHGSEAQRADTCHVDQKSEHLLVHLCPAELWQARMEILSVWPTLEGAGYSADNTVKHWN